MPGVQEKYARWLKQSVFTSLALGLSVWITLPALAGYIPPPKPSAPPKDTTSRTIRGNCISSSPGKLTALAPVSHVGQSSARRPTFVWYVPDQKSYRLQFRLLDADGQRFYQTMMQSQPGLMQFSLPDDQPELTVGQQYRWQVVLICDSNSLSRIPVTGATIEVIDLPSGLQAQLKATRTPQQRVDLYAKNGIWYDALAEAVNSDRASQPSSAVLDLLDSLASSEAQAMKEWSNQLRQIIAIVGQRPQP